MVGDDDDREQPLKKLETLERTNSISNVKTFDPRPRVGLISGQNGQGMYGMSSLYRLGAAVLLVVVSVMNLAMSWSDEIRTSRRVYSRQPFLQVHGDPYWAYTHSTRRAGDDGGRAYAYPVVIEHPHRDGSYVPVSHDYEPGIPGGMPGTVREMVPEKYRGWYDERVGREEDIRKVVPTFYGEMVALQARNETGMEFPNFGRCLDAEKSRIDVDEYWGSVEELFGYSQRVQACIRTGQVRMVDVSRDPQTDLSPFSSMDIHFTVTALLWISASFAVWKLDALEGLGMLRKGVPYVALVWNLFFFLLTLAKILQDALPLNNGVILALAVAYTIKGQWDHTKGDPDTEQRAAAGPDTRARVPGYACAYAPVTQGGLLWSTDSFFQPLRMEAGFKGRLKDSYSSLKSRGQGLIQRALPGYMGRLEKDDKLTLLWYTEQEVVLPLLLVTVLLAECPGITLDLVQVLFVALAASISASKDMYRVARHNKKAVQDGVHDQYWMVYGLAHLASVLLLCGLALGLGGEYATKMAGSYRTAKGDALFALTVLALVLQGLFYVAALACTVLLFGGSSAGRGQTMMPQIWGSVNLGTMLYMGFLFSTWVTRDDLRAAA